jgi:hypothetical protein
LTTRSLRGEWIPGAWLIVSPGRSAWLGDGSRCDLRRSKPSLRAREGPALEMVLVEMDLAEMNLAETQRSPTENDFG